MPGIALRIRQGKAFTFCGGTEKLPWIFFYKSWALQQYEDFKEGTKTTSKILKGYKAHIPYETEKTLEK